MLNDPDGATKRYGQLWRLCHVPSAGGSEVYCAIPGRRGFIVSTVTRSYRRARPLGGVYPRPTQTQSDSRGLPKIIIEGCPGRIYAHGLQGPAQ